MFPTSAGKPHLPISFVPSTTVLRGAAETSRMLGHKCRMELLLPSCVAVGLLPPTSSVRVAG